MTVAALGGIFIYSENPAHLAAWYERCFDLQYEYTEASKAYYLSFSYCEGSNARRRYMAFSILHSEHRPIVDGKFYTLNLRVHRMEDALERLRSLHVDFTGPQAHEEGLFAWLNDPEGNYIELWEDTPPG